MKKKITLPILFILLTGMILSLIYYVVSNYDYVSFLDEQMMNYMEDDQWDETEVLSVFPEGTAEISFIKGITCFADGRIEEAGQYFEEAEGKPHKDPTLPFYLAFYQNKCIVAETGKTDPVLVEGVLEELARCADIFDPPYWAWELVYPVAENKKAEISAVELMENYLDKADELTVEQRIQLESYLAILKNITGEYSESIMLFYDVLAKAQDEPETHAMIKTQSICINYIAEMYYSYEDYEKAEELYLRLIDKTLEDPYEDAQMKYMAYINMANIYLEQKDYVRAQEMVTETEQLLVYFDEEMAAEIEAFCYNILANIELAQGNISGAQEYFKVCEEFLINHKSSTFFDTEVYFKLTKCKILVRSREHEEAEQILTKLLKEHNVTESNVVYKIREELAELYYLSGQTMKYYDERSRLLDEQKARIRQYQSDYCEAINYYEQLVTLQKEHQTSVHQNEVLAFGLVLVFILLVFILKVSVGRYRDSVTDALSGLYNRKQLEKEIIYYEKNNQKFMSYGVIMMDIDFFKRYNDTYGHAAGDEVIRRVAGVMKQSVRKQDIVIRYGGEEFLVLLRDINSSTIESIAERIRVNVQKEQIQHEESECSAYVSLSLGGFYVEDTTSIHLQEAIKEADNALYESKRNGRNRVTVYET